MFLCQCLSINQSNGQGRVVCRHDIELSILVSRISENFKFGFIVNCNQWRWGLDLIGDQIGVAGSKLETWKTGCYSTETVRKSESDRMGARSVQGFCMVPKEIYRKASWKVMLYGELRP